MRTRVIQSAFAVLFVLKASSAYSEQVGTNLQDGGSTGERKRRYRRIA